MADPSLIIAMTGLVISLGGVLGAWLNSRIAARKNDLDTITNRLQVAIDQANRDNEKLRVRLDEVEKDNTDLRQMLREMERERSSNLRRIEQLECQVADLEAQLIAAGLTPVTKKDKAK